MPCIDYFPSPRGRLFHSVVWLCLILPWAWPALASGIPTQYSTARRSIEWDADRSTDSLPYPFIDRSYNHILRSEALKPFFDRLRSLESGGGGRVRIVHIGDSHIQADLFTGPLRSRFQERFGSAGRGLVFPFSLVNSNDPADIRTSSSFSWESRRNASGPVDIPLGICGISLRTRTPGGDFHLSLRPAADSLIDYAFDRVTLFYESSVGFSPFFPVLSPPVFPAAAHRRHLVQAGETLYALSQRYACTVSDLQRWNGLSGTRINVGQRLVVGRQPEAAGGVVVAPDVTSADGASFSLPQPYRQLTIRAGGERGSAAPGILYGLLLDCTQRSGILYHAIGVNGVTYRHYNQAERFWRQLPLLDPDLVIVSLGTNEALGAAFEKAAFQGEVERFVDHLRRWAPGCPVLLTTNPDVLRRRRYEHSANLEVRQAILEAAATAGLAVWDLHAVMGGHGAVRQWRAYQLTGTDYIHFTKDGYRLQASLLFEALMNAYASRP